mmetsp:Transcript_37215/g.37688  ORF Transcript_37215/g.37688 Transcript_37215/m.37688 type:complete len:95 (-) Transcript_37215:265-549(-)
MISTIASKRAAAAIIGNPSSVSRIVAPTSMSLSTQSIPFVSHPHSFNTTSEHELKNAVDDLGILTQEQRIKYFKVYRYDPNMEDQKPLFEYLSH